MVSANHEIGDNDVCTVKPVFSEMLRLVGEIGARHGINLDKSHKIKKHFIKR